jgi:6-phosphogluconate dehydrogenase (decarboxylating)
MIAIFGAAAGWARRAREAGLPVLGLPLSEAESDILSRAGAELVASSAQFFERMEHPRLHLLDMAPGPGIDELIDRAYLTMEPGDVVLDASGSYWGDTLRRWRRMRHRAIFYLDLALIEGVQGPTMLVAGEPRGIEPAAAVLETLAAAGRLVVAGGPGAAHYTQCVGEAYMLAARHAASEAAQMLEAYPGQLDASAAADAIGLPLEAAEPRAAWLIDDALRLDAAVPLLSHAVMLEQARSLDEHVRPPWLPRIGPFVRPDDLG